jgi:UDP-3-O-acyl-N-acetylglucosamine deacetylase
MTFPRRTLASEARFEGIGLHSGNPVTVVVHPGEEGIWFRCGSERVQAIPANVSDTSRCTKLGGISTIEHLMSAFAGLEVTDAEVELDAPELPAAGGCSAPYVEGLTRAGFSALPDGEADLPYARLFHHDGEIRIAMGRGTGHWRFLFDAGDRWPGAQSFETESVVDRYASDIAPARTFAFAEEVPQIIQAGLAKGLDATSALLLGIEGYKNDPRMPDEPARHKLLDLIGDLYLAGVPIRHLNVAAERSGHRTNVAAAAILRRAAGLD